MSGRVVRTGEAVLLQDDRTDSAFIGAIPGIASQVCVPLYDAGRVVGTLNVESCDEIHLTDDDLHLMVVLSEHVSVAIGRARLSTDVRRTEAPFGSLIHNALDIITILDADGTVCCESPAGCVEQPGAHVDAAPRLERPRMQKGLTIIVLHYFV